MEIRCIMKLPGSSIRWHVDIFGMLVGPCAVCQVLDMLGARATQAFRVIVSSNLFGPPAQIVTDILHPCVYSDSDYYVTVF